jgi:hypothetical protein
MLTQCHINTLNLNYLGVVLERMQNFLWFDCQEKTVKCMTRLHRNTSANTYNNLGLNTFKKCI